MSTDVQVLTHTGFLLQPTRVLWNIMGQLLWVGEGKRDNGYCAQGGLPVLTGMQLLFTI